MIFIGETALSYAVVNGIVNIVRYLLDHGANPDKSGPGNRTPLHMAVGQGLYLFSISVGTIYKLFPYLFSLNVNNCGITIICWKIGNYPCSSKVVHSYYSRLTWLFTYASCCRDFSMMNGLGG